MSWPGVFGELRSKYALPPHPPQPAMSNHASDSFDADALPSPYRQGQLPSNAHWIFGSIYAALTFVGFGVGVWAGAPPKAKPVETADAKKDADKPAPKTAPAPTPPVPNPGPPPVAMPVGQPKP